MKDLIDEVRRMSSFFERMEGFCVCVKDKKGKYVYVNTCYADIMGETVPNLLYRMAADVWEMSEEEALQIRQDEESLLRGEVGSVRRVMKKKSPQGEDEYYCIIKAPVCSENDNEILGTVAIVVDTSYESSMLLMLLQILLRRLSDAEKRYFFLRTQGLSRAEISKNMNTTVETVDSHRHRVMGKMKINSEEMEEIEGVLRFFLDRAFMEE